MSYSRTIGMLLVALVAIQPAAAQYQGTGSITQGRGTVTIKDLFVCPKGRPTNLGTIRSQDDAVWNVPADVNFSTAAFPASHDLHNACSGVMYANATEARAGLAGSNVVTVDADGEVLTAYVFADNYFEMYVNGIPVGKDNVPFTQFNSSAVRFRVRRPFTVAMLAVDWEENLGLGSEAMGNSPYHPGDAGVVAVFMDEGGNIIATTSREWKAQTYYISPVQDLTCLSEQNGMRLSGPCSTADASDGSQFYGVHWARPSGWMNTDFDDAAWPLAKEYSNNLVGVDNKPAYTNFTEIFDAPLNDAAFIWTSNLVLDNEVLLRYRVPGPTSVGDSDDTAVEEPSIIRLYGVDGTEIAVAATKQQLNAMLDELPSGCYLQVCRRHGIVETKHVLHVR
ncbi:MAG: hypothetical protein FGM24_00750 [Candidatus Kapabacteria bacterium]|nr:hypothetical protein [Candidatus Kapabacteria bacterium]